MESERYHGDGGWDGICWWEEGGPQGAEGVFYLREGEEQMHCRASEAGEV